jgi:hypothetical protein
MTLAFWVLGLILCLARPSDAVLGEALVVMLVLWIFSFLDAYFTAIEINRGQDDLVDDQNPRVAVTLNLLTAGFGYFYLGEQVKGLFLFVALQVARFTLPTSGYWGVSIGLLLVVVQVAVALDAYRIARRRVKERLAAEPVVAALGSAAPASRLPVQVPAVLACMLPFAFIVFIVVGLAFNSIRSGKRTAAAALNHRVTVEQNVERNQDRSDSQHARNDVPVTVVDFATAVQDVQRVRRKAEGRKNEVLNLKQDVQMFSATLNAKKMDPSDAMVAHYYRALALALINGVHEEEGEAMDVAGARTARADLDKIIKSDGVVTYVPEITQSNAEYWAGSIARNQLHDEKLAYSYWKKCAASKHAGCINIVAGARITGDGGEPVDLNEALALHAGVYETGITFRCAGAMSAMNIAGINYFMGVRRPGDDELEWTKKADALLDRLEEKENSRNVCDRAGVEVDEFLFQLSRRNRDDNILQDAMGRLGDDSKPTKALIQFISGAIDEAGLTAAVNSNKSAEERCSAYFDALWYAELRGKGAMAQRFERHLVDLGKFDCGQEMVFAKKFKF